MSTKNPQSTLEPIQPLTGLAAIADEQRARAAQEAMKAFKETSPNPARKALNDLRGGLDGLTSKASDVEGTSLRSRPENTAKAGRNPPSSTAGRKQSEPIDSRLVELDKNAKAKGSGPILDNEEAVASPGPIDNTTGDEEESQSRGQKRRADSSGPLGEEPPSGKAFTYPGPGSASAYRTTSLPHAGNGRDHTSPQTKRHKCPFCNTDFTRHHNLKSHLLTHSQEKPFNCDKCDSRFRRLHDLKRHTKLHTGERPHVCPKCDRSFARGDALARHTKGEGGCAGRRESMGSFTDEKLDESLRSSDGETMSGIRYTGDATREPERYSNGSESPLSRSLPTIHPNSMSSDADRRHADSNQSSFGNRGPKTYPPITSRTQPAPSLYPPVAPLTSPRGASGPAAPSHPYPTTTSNIFHGGVTESPKPLSPGAVGAPPPGSSAGNTERKSPRQSSPGHSARATQYRQPSGRGLSPSIALPTPSVTSAVAGAPQLPPLQALSPQETRYPPHSSASALSLQHMHSPGMKAPGQGPMSPAYPPGQQTSANNSLSSHSAGTQASIDRSSTFGTPNERLWAHIDMLTAKINRLEEEVSSLKAQCGPVSSHR